MFHFLVTKPIQILSSGMREKKMCNVLSQFIQQATDIPDNVAVIHGDARMTYQHLNQESDRLCGVLQQAGVNSNHIVPLIAQRTPELIIGILAIAKTGAAYIPVDIHYPERRIVQITRQSDSPVILISHRAFSAIAGTAAQQVIAIDQSREGIEVPATLHLPYPGDTAYVIFTSGTTGIPKGVMISHAALSNLVNWHNTHFDMDQHSRSTLMAGIGFDVAQWEIWSPLICGATLILPDNEEARLQTDSLLRFFAVHKMTHAFVPTVLVPEIVNQPQPDNLALRYLFTAGEKLNPVNLTRANFQLIDYYGPTEATIFTTCNTVVCATQNPLASIGFPIAGAEVFILDEQLNPVTNEQPGELFIGGPGLATGYLNNPGLTKEKFLTLPFAPEKYLYRSGDRARWLPDGRIQYLGRLDDQVKIRGNRVELGEIESILLQAEGVKGAVVLVTLEESASEKRILAFVAAECGNSAILKETLRAHLTDSLPAYFMPAGIQILPRLPLTANGKTDKQALLAGYFPDLPAASPAAALHGTGAILTEVWKTLLTGVTPGPDDNFFALGGHSLLAARMASAITKQTGIRAYVRDIYDYPTIRSLAHALELRNLSAPSTADSEPLRILQDDIFLPDDVRINPHFDERQISTPRYILLTGATGFVGSHLLADLLQSTHAHIYCLIRSKNTETARQKLTDTLDRYLIPLTDEHLARIHPLAGDLAEPHFGLKQEEYHRISQETDIIYHSASAVNFIQPYSYMKRDNVQGLREVIRFAAVERTKPLMLLSTISVYSWGHLHTGKRIMREDDDIDQNLPAVITDIGYVRSKWVMEKIADLAAARGLPLMTFRLGYATSHSMTGVSAGYQWWGRLVKTCLDTGTVPALQDLREGLTTVDYMTRAIAYITRNPKALGHKFNLIHEQQNNLTLNAFFNLLEQYFDFRFSPLPFTDWLAQWEQDADAPLYPLLSLFKDNMTGGQSTVQLYQDTYLWDCSNVKHFLQGSDIQEPVFTRDLLERYLYRSIGCEGLSL
ncbi:MULTISPECIES: non-ribosomal peptide synthetase [unclassified Pseudomonas]|uniref:non-ribosomal peptide synthetase n=1 Tax=unclassified Pseudomonas TaxID=196821 RepID=UPI001EFE50AE|nr:MULTISPECIES: non-ribosomal peptide synthetase [unclassified Pseudomonas]